MNVIDILDLEVGNYFTEDVFLDQEYLLLTPEIPVSSDLISRLRKWNFKLVYTNGQATKQAEYKIEKLATKTSISIDNNDEDKLEREKANNFFKESIEFTRHLFEVFIKKDDLDRGAIIEKIKEIRQNVLENKDLYFSLAEIPNEKDFIVIDAVKSAIYSLALADFLKLPIHRQIDVGIAAYLHDLGMLKIPQKIYLTDKPLSDQERRIIQAHVNLSAQAVLKANFSKDIVQAILEHHECYNGTGYPQGLDGNLITISGKIVAIVSSYVAATSNRMHRDKMLRHNGIIDILKQTNKKYDPKIAKAFILMLSIYPLGTFVELQDGTKGIVSKTSIHNPKTPVVKLLLDKDNRPFTLHKEVLTHTEGSFIKRTLNESEILNLKNVYRFASHMQKTKDK